MSTVARNWREIPQRYRMEAGKCTSCGTVWFPPRRICSECKGREFTTVVLPEEGEVETYTIIRVAPSGFGDLAPYAVGIVKLSDETRIMCQVVDCSPEEVKIGMPVRIEFRRVNEEGEDGMLIYGYKCVPA
jgi:uncharacterized OB-fold protein